MDQEAGISTHTGYLMPNLVIWFLKELFVGNISTQARGHLFTHS